MRHLVDRTGRAGAAVHVAVDAVLAAGFLVALAAALPAALQLGNRFFVHVLNGPPVVWQPFLEAAQVDPILAGLPVTGMLFSTLVPTAAHLLLALTALVLMPMPFRGSILRWLEGEPHFWQRCGVIAWLWFAVAFALVLLVGGGAVLWWAISLSGETLGGWLYDVAAWSATQVGGPGQPTFE
ncbi:MAG: hypothetical protein IPM60_12955 [Rhodospirillales bacterium]|nr:hypothetical protein [Rhodospirillales bacterium]